MCGFSREKLSCCWEKGAFVAENRGTGWVWRGRVPGRRPGYGGS